MSRIDASTALSSVTDDDDAARYWAGRLAVSLDWPQEVHRFRGRGHVRAAAG